MSNQRYSYKVIEFLDNLERLLLNPIDNAIVVDNKKIGQYSVSFTKNDYERIWIDYIGDSELKISGDNFTFEINNIFEIKPNFKIVLANAAKIENNEFFDTMARRIDRMVKKEPPEKPSLMRFH